MSILPNFTKRNKLNPDLQARIPPGQYLTEKFPVLTYGPIPRVQTETWTLRLFGEVAQPVTLSWADFLALPQTDLQSDFHCVTHWSRLDNVWTGVAIRDILNLVEVRPAATHVMAHAVGGYTTNMPLSVLNDDDVLIAHRHDGQPLTPEHGYPARLVVPKRYAWKSAKWLSGLEFMAEDRPGFWERNGYSNSAEPWAEERYW
jgi:DMSO/TMAO reductase YedYZ molybdopterin-dependent catalytic subunit